MQVARVLWDSGENRGVVVFNDTVRLVYSTITDERPAVGQGLCGCRAGLELDSPRAATAIPIVSGTGDVTLRLVDVVGCSREEPCAAMTLGGIAHCIGIVYSDLGIVHSRPRKGDHCVLVPAPAIHPP